MTTTQPGSRIDEFCDSCERTTGHLVRIELRTESSRPKNAQFSREPYRVSECGDCGAETTTRMNDA